MNVTDKQKEIILHFMKSHRDFDRGRIRSKGESKKQLDHLWVQLSEKVNSAGCGPQKTPREWAKTWRDWKNNVLKKVATYKSYASGTGGGPPIKLQTNRLEDDLLEFMSPDASGLSGIPEGGFGDNLESLENISCLNTQPSISSNNEIKEIDWMSNSFQESKNVDPMTEHFDVSTYEEGGYPAPKKIIIEGVTSLQKRVQQSATPAQPQESLPRKKPFLGKKRRIRQ